ncbi:Siderochrome-iron transporter [Pleurostoma richardsiae]|uniref:Siderochrome-iron transporter n=1 Tax=Pleurostoma richardsiae TaxID=41990 RepID=A0AA38VWB4_9PEZI|nr:Siderochrome-iron transporter [Pleurostoma richardsiae]
MDNDVSVGVAPATLRNDVMGKKVDAMTTDIEVQKADSVAAGDATGASKMEAIQAVWGKHGKLYILIALCICQIAFEFDNTTVYTYYVYAQSTFNKISNLAALTTAGTLSFAVLKPLIAKLSDVFGRGELYPIVLVLYLVSYILCAKSPNYESYATGYMFHMIAQTGINTLNDILAADISSARQRGLAIQVQFLPNVFMPFISAFVTSSVVHGIGWRWGIGMLAIIIPFGMAPLIGTVLGFQRKAKRAGFNEKVHLSFYDFFSEIDMGGMALFSGGLALILLPATIAGDLKHGWHTNWVIACLVLGGICLIALPLYEYYWAKHPLMPIKYFKSLTITMAIMMYAMDGISLGVTHSYFYTWLIVARGYPIRHALWIYDVNRAFQFCTGLLMGGIMWSTRRYKWSIVLGVAMRLLGYGLMFRIRNASSSTAEIVIVQLIQGFGSGLVGTGCFVAVTVNVPHREVAQMTSLAVCLSMLGSAIGTAIGGGIYTSQFKAQLVKELGSYATPKLINSVFNSITAGLPAMGTPQRQGIARAYNTIMAYFTYVAFGSIVPSVVFAWFLPNKKLTDAHNLVEEQPSGLELDAAPRVGQISRDTVN